MAIIPAAFPWYRRCTLPARVRPGLEVLTAFSLFLTTGCGQVDPLSLTGPSPLASSPAAPAPPAVQDFPSLTGRWRLSGGTALRNLDTGNTLTRGSCSGSFTITQDGATFSGPFNAQGGGWNSDRFCTASGTFTGELLTTDGSVAHARLQGNFENWPRPSVTPSCEFVSRGDGVWTGSATSDAIRLEISDVLRCPVNADGGLAGMPMAEFERTVSLTFQRW